MVSQRRGKNQRDARGKILMDTFLGLALYGDLGEADMMVNGWALSLYSGCVQVQPVLRLFSFWTIPARLFKMLVEKRRWGHLKFEVRTKKNACTLTLPYALKRGHKLTWKIEPTYDKNNGNYLQLPSQQIRFLIHLRQYILGDPKRCQLPSALIIF